MSERKEFKTETKRLLDLMINSIYTNKEIFLRELISNASDAIDKYHYLSLQDEKLERRNDYKITIAVNEEERTITISDNGVGMTYDEIINNLGTIASSGSLEFMKKLENLENENENEIDIIGQFGVGFYSAFMVASRVEVTTLSPYSDKAYLFTSTGEDSYELDEVEKESVGTSIKLFLRENTEEEDYDEFLSEWEIKSLVMKYCDYIRYPITMNCKHSEPMRDSEGKIIEGKYNEFISEDTLNSMIPLWKKNKKDVTKEELNEFYKKKFNDYTDPLLATHINVEGMISYSALVFIPSKAPYDLYSEKYEKGLQLYTKGVFIMDKCKDLIPDYLRFVKGLVDSSDLSLNISREMLQKDRQLKKIQTNVEKKILNELENLKQNDYDKYLEFFEIYGANLKFGIYENYGDKKDLLKDLIVYYTLENSEKPITLKEYKEKMKEGQEYIYFASGANKEAVLSMPQMDLLKKKGYDVLVLVDSVDEFAIMMLEEYDGVKFKSISQGDLDVLDEEEKKNIEELKEVKKPLLDALKDALNEEVSDVKLSERLVDSPVCLVSGEGISFEMEKALSQNPNGNGLKATRILEINPNHDLFLAIEKAYETSPETLKQYAKLLLNQALLIEGMPISDPQEFSKMMCDLMIKASSK